MQTLCSIENVALRQTFLLGLRTQNSHGFRYVATSSRQPKRRTHYEVLGVPYNASMKDIKSAFLEKSKKLHPDKNPEDPDHSKFVRLNEAYSVLGRPSSRQSYDLSIRHGIIYETREPHTSRTHDYTSSNYYDDFQIRERMRYEQFWETQHRRQQEMYGSRSHQPASNFQSFIGMVILLGIGTLIFFSGFVSAKKSNERSIARTRESLMMTRQLQERGKLFHELPIEEQMEIITKNREARLAMYRESFVNHADGRTLSGKGLQEEEEKLLSMKLTYNDHSDSH